MSHKITRPTLRASLSSHATFSLLLVLAGCGWRLGTNANEPVIGGPCDGCEHVFVEMPKALSSQARIAPASEPGEPLIIEGRVLTSAGQPASGIIVYAYHTDASGVYPAGATQHGRLRGWARTDQEGRYRFLTIRPGSYPDRQSPQHIHMHIIEPGIATYYIDDIVFDDDPLLTPERRREYRRGRGGEGIASPGKNADGAWQVRRDIVLGKNINGYEKVRR